MKNAEIKNYIPTLDGWRAVAILGVLMAHGCESLFTNGGPFANQLLFALTREGAVGVNIFFGISGFLICTRLLQEKTKHSKISLKAFYIRRAFRILPPFVFYLAVIGGLSLLGLLSITFREWITSLLFVRNYLSPESLGGWYTGHLWSLAVEEHFYLLLPGLLVLLGARQTRTVLYFLIAAISIWRMVDFRFQIFAKILPQTGFYGRTDIILDGLLLGALSAIIWQESKKRVASWLRPWLFWVTVPLFVLCLAYDPPFKILLQSILIVLMLFSTMANPQTLAGRLFELAPIAWIGRLSYSLYIWNNLFLVPTGVAAPFGILQQWPYNFAALLATAAFSYYLVERPLIKVGHRLAAR
jgi:peptidoglycan/LPS O-acetylase OafA/YrhL